MIRLLSFVVLVGMTTLMGIYEGFSAQGFEQPLSFVYSVEVQGSGASVSEGNLIYRFLPGVTRVETQEEIYHIDYRRKTLYRIDTNIRNCFAFPLHSGEDVEILKGTDPGRDDLMKKEFTRQLGTASLEKRVLSRKTLNGFTVHKVTVVWGKNLLMQRKLQSPSIERYGRKFLPEVQKYWVTTAIDRMDDLFYLAAAYEPMFSANPLLGRIDPLGILKQLQGYPVKLTTRRYVAVLRDVSMEKEETEHFTLPDSCTSTR